jgi:hypothetical protein
MELILQFRSSKLEKLNRKQLDVFLNKTWLLDLEILSETNHIKRYNSLIEDVIKK